MEEIHPSFGARHVIRRLAAAGFDGHVVGGAVRDALIGKEPKDWDVATDARPEQVMAVFPRHHQLSNDFGTVTVRVPVTTITLTPRGRAPVAPAAGPLDLVATIRARRVGFREFMSGKWIRGSAAPAPDPEGDAIVRYWTRRLRLAQ